MAMAKFRFCPSVEVRVVMPMTWPCKLNKGPPLLPFEIGALVCKTFVPFKSLMELINPSETVFSKPWGFPRATTRSPSFTLSESPSSTGVSESAVSILRSAISRIGLSLTMATFG